MDFKEYIVQRIEEMPLVTLATEEKDGAVCIDFTKVDEKMYNGVLIGNTANAAKILTEEYMTAVTPDAEKDQLLWFTYEGMTEKALKKKMNMMEAFAVFPIRTPLYIFSSTFVKSMQTAPSFSSVASVTSGISSILCTIYSLKSITYISFYLLSTIIVAF